MTRRASMELSDSSNRSLRSNISWTAFGNVVYAITQWGVITALAKMGDPQTVGLFALALAIAAPIMQFFNMQLRSVQATDARNEHPFQSYFFTRLFTTAAALLVVFCALVAGDYSGQATVVIVLIAVAKAVDALADVFYGMFQRRERMDIVSKALMFNGTLSLMFLAGGYYITGDIVVGAIGFVLGSVVPVTVYVLPAAKRMLRDGPNQGTLRISAFDKRDIRSLVILAAPMGVVALLTSLQSNIPRYFIQAHWGEYELGVFAALAYLIVAGNVVVSAIGQAISPRLSQYYADKRIGLFRRSIVRLAVLGMAIGVAGAAVASMTGDKLLEIIYTSDYAGYEKELILMSVSAGVTFAAAFLGYGLTAARMFAIQVPMVGIVTLTVTLCSALLVPVFGILGAVYALFLAGVVNLAIFSAVLHRATSHITWPENTQGDVAWD